MKKTVLLFSLLLFPIVASADDSGSCGKNATYTYVEATKTLTISGKGDMNDYHAYYNAPWDSYKEKIQNLIIENGVTSIGQWAFEDCSGLTSVFIPNSVTRIADGAFHGCSGLTSVTIPNSVTSIGSSAFSGCSGLTSVTIGNSVTSIGNWAFSGCSGLTRVTIPNSVTSIGLWAFEDCSGLTSVTIGNSVTSIGNFAFEGCSGLTSVNIMNLAAWCNIIFFGYEANPLYYAHHLYLNGEELKDDLVIPNSVTRIADGAFYGCSGLTSVTIPNSVTSIGIGAFSGCSGLTSVTIPNSVTSIGDEAFSGCTGLTSVTIPNSVTSISGGAFSGCSGLTSVTIPNSVTSISGSAFSGCSGLTNVTIPNSVTSISDGAFSSCTGLTSVTIPNSVTSIGSSAFQYCSGLTSVTIGNSVTSIGSSAFSGCFGLTSVTICNVFRIAEWIFTNTTYGRATLYVPMGWKSFFQEDVVWGKFSSIVEVDMPDVKIEDKPFEMLNSKRLIIGYTNGDKNDFRPKTNSDTGDYAQAIKFPKERMTRIKGNQITHIRFNSKLTTESAFDIGIADMKIWIGSSRNQRDLFCQDITDLREGWNVIALEHPYTITGDSIIVGVSFHKNKEGYLDIPIEGVENVDDGENILGFDNGRWFEGWRGAGGKWYIAWHIQCMVEGDNIPKYDAQIVHWGSAPWLPLYKRAIKAGEEFSCYLKLRNWGSMSFNASDLLALLDGEEVECSWGSKTIYRGNLGIQDGILLRVTPSKNTKVGNHKLTLKPKKQNGEEYQEVSNEISLKVYEHDMGRQKVLVQVYAGQGCSYCPEFDEQVEKKEKERDDLVTININGYWWQGMSTSEASKIYDNVFSCGFVPSIDLNRCFDKQTFDHRPSYRSSILSQTDEAKAQPSFANVNISGSYHKGSRTVDITVSGERNEDFVSLEKWTNLTVLLVEDGVIGYQAGADDPNNYSHNGVIRSNVSAVWGDLVEWNGDKYELHYTATLDEEWNHENMRVVAFLGKPFTGDNFEEIGIVNCEEMHLKDMPVGIYVINIEETVSDLYDINGRKVRSNAKSLEGLPKGVYIVGGKKIVK